MAFCPSHPMTPHILRPTFTGVQHRVLPPPFLLNPTQCTPTQTVVTTTQQTAWHSNGAWQSNQEHVRHARHIDSQPQTQPWQNRGGHYGRNNNGHQAQHRRGPYKAKPHTRSPENSEPKPVQDYKMILTRHTNPPAALTSQGIREKTGLAVTWLGTSSGKPTLDRNVSCTVVRTPNSTVLVDCGEGSSRQLPAAGIDLTQVTNIFITHLHGDHCFGLGSTLQAIDQAKRQAQQQADGDVQFQIRSSNEHVPVTYVWGPPGVVELLHAQLIITGAHRYMHGRVIITELVTAPEDAMLTPQPLVAGSDKFLVRRLPPRSIDDIPPLAAASEAVAPRLDRIPQVWLPPRQHFSPRVPAMQSMDDDSAMYGGRNYVAAQGMVWDLSPPPTYHYIDGRLVLQQPENVPPPELRAYAAQLQHRVPCWGFVFQEARPATFGTRRRKVVILGDTIDSSPIAPLAMGCDILSHEATFVKGMEDKCRVAQHSTGWMAGMFAAAVGAKLLVLTHFSARYEGPAPQSFNRGGRQQRDGRDNLEDKLTAAEELQLQNQAVHALISEAQAQHPHGKVLAAVDFFTIHVPVATQQEQQQDLVSSRGTSSRAIGRRPAAALTGSGV